MAITDAGGPSMFMGQTGQSSPFSSLSLPTINPVNNNPAPAWGSSDIYKTLTQAAPQSLTDMLAPLISQIYGSQANALQPIFQQMTNQNVASAQSDAMARGLTGSSIEAANMTGARQQGSNAFTQYLSGQLNNIIPTLLQTGQTDISNQNQYYNQIAQGIGQQQSQQLQQQQFLDMLNANIGMAKSANTAGLESAGIGAAGKIGAAALPLAFSDVRLKENIMPIGLFNGIPVYSFEYKQDTQFDLPSGTRVGCLGHEVMEHRPDCVDIENGYLKVNYSKLMRNNA